MNDESSILSASELDLKKLHEIVRRIEQNVESVVLGKQEIARLCIVALLSGEHILLEDVPGVGKTLMGKSIAKSVDGSFARVQFTPDLLPSDIVGSSIYKSDSAEFVFNQGPIFNNFVLADEINRAPPRTQSAMLEAMSDAQVSVDGTTHNLALPFMVIATQNPFEFEGTYVLPESQLDRFLMRISMGYPDPDFELDILTSHQGGEPIDNLKSVATTQEVLQLQAATRAVKVDTSIARYMMDIVNATRNSEHLNVGVSTRGALLWYRAVQAMAFAEGRNFATPDDAKRLAIAVIAHRVTYRGMAQQNPRETVESIVRSIVSSVPAPD